MVPDDISSDGRVPESELYERLRRCRPLRFPRDGEMLPSNLLDARKISITTPLRPQVIPSHSQQSVPSCQGMVTLSSNDNPAMNWRRELLSFLLHDEVAGETMERSNTRERPKKAMASLE
jgi:hypothetical protein